MQYLPEASHIVFLEGGKIEAQGSFRNLSEVNEKFAELMKDHGVFEEEDQSAEDGKNKLKMSVGVPDDNPAEKRKDDVRHAPLWFN